MQQYPMPMGKDDFARPLKNETQDVAFQRWRERKNSLAPEEIRNFMIRVKSAGGYMEDSSAQYTRYMANVTLFVPTQ